MNAIQKGVVKDPS